MSGRVTRRAPLLASLLLLAAAGLAYACRGTSTPPCGRSIFLGKYPTRVVLIGPLGGGTLQVFVQPFLTWSLSPACAQPMAASIQANLEIQPAGGGNPILLGPIDFVQPVPTAPGAQPTSTLNIPIPAGTLPPALLPATGRLDLCYEVMFGAGTGGGALRACGSNEVCFVPPAAPTGKYSTVPALDLQHLSPDPMNPFPICPRGDQAVTYFLICNNRKKAVDLDLESEGKQVAVLAEGETPATAYANLNYAISATGAGEDTFTAGFKKELMPGEILRELDPSVPDPQRLVDSFRLKPLRCAILAIAMRSHGMCLDGSCNERFVKVTGAWTDGMPALACAATVMLVGERPPKTPLCDITDLIQAGELSQAVWGPAHYGDATGFFPHQETHAVGNLPPGSGPATELFGQLFPVGPIGGSPQATDHLRTLKHVTRVAYSGRSQVFGVIGMDPLQRFIDVEIVSLDLVSVNPITVPMVFERNIPVSNLMMRVQVGQGTTTPLQVFRPGNAMPIYTGSLEELMTSPPPFLGVEAGTQRTFSKQDLRSIPMLEVSTPAIARTLVKSKVSGTEDRIRVFLRSVTKRGVRAQGPVPGWTAEIVGAGARLVKPEGPLDKPIRIRYTTSGTQSSPAVNHSVLKVTVPGALNSPLLVPIALRWAKKL